MGQVGPAQAGATVLLADADVLIDYRDSELTVLKLVAQHVGRVAVIPPVLDEVHGLTAGVCARLDIEVIEVEEPLIYSLCKRITVAKRERALREFVWER